MPPDYPTITMTGMESWEEYSLEHGHCLVFRAKAAAFDGQTNPTRRGEDSRQMFQLYPDGDGLAVARHRCHAGSPPINEEMWLRFGVITDGQWVYSKLGGHEIRFQRLNYPA